MRIFLLDIPIGYYPVHFPIAYGNRSSFITSYFSLVEKSSVKPVPCYALWLATGVPPYYITGYDSNCPNFVISLEITLEFVCSLFFRK